MSYKKIYAEFIADRRSKEAALLASGEYFERHHILPRSLGGADKKENLIALTAADHFFAHFYLGHIYGGAMWRAVELMVGNPHRKSDLANDVENFAELYAIAAEKAANAQRDMMTKKYQDKDYKNNWLKKMAAFQAKAKSNGHYTRRNNIRYSNREERKKTGDAMRRVYELNPELKIAAAKRSKERWADETFKTKVSDLHKKRWLNPELRQQVSGKIAAFWKDNDEARKRCSAKSKKSWIESYEKRVAAVRVGAKRKSERLRSELCKVICRDENVVFENYFEAAEWLKQTKKIILKNPRDIEVVCKGKNKTAGGFRWAYA